MSNSATRGERALRAMQDADRYRNRPCIRPSDPYWNRRDAEKAEAEAEQLMQTGAMVRGCGELVRSDPADAEVQPWMVDTLANPNMVVVDASEQRLEAAADAGVLAAAVDAAQSAQAANSLEKMLCHQMAGAHYAGMKLLARSINENLPPLEAARLSNAAARMMEVYQQGVLTLQKIRTGGRQTVVVQHVQVSDGGQAVVAGELNGTTKGLHPASAR